MSNRESEGPIQVWGNSPQEINDALAQIQNRLDHLKGLRGRTELWDRVRAEDPTQEQDVLTKGSFGTVARIEFFSWRSPYFIRPGVSVNQLNVVSRRRFNFGGGRVLSGRLTFHGWGSESGDKRIGAFDETGNTPLAIIDWSGTTEGWYVGETLPFTLTEDQYVVIGCGASSSTEAIVINNLILELNG